jgi:hypothetical protein
MYDSLPGLGIPFFIQQVSGGYIVTSFKYSVSLENKDMWLLKLDSNGDIPGCNIVNTSDAIVTDTFVIGVNSNVSVQTTTAIVADTSIIPQDTSAEITTICSWIDSDDDSVSDDEDNCPNDYNPLQEDTDNSGIGDACNDSIDADGDEWEDSFDNCLNTPNPNQEDTYPPQGNSIGDACDCECDFDCSGGVDATDVTAFLVDFGRSPFFNPCTNASPCNGDVDCNVNVDADDVTMFLQDFGRSQFFNPCPACVAGDWCVYP